MTYGEQLKDPRWQKRRLEILQRDEWTCQECNAKTKTLHVHHRHYLRGRMAWEHPDDALVTLCADCHAAFTTIRKQLDVQLGQLCWMDLQAIVGFVAGLRAGNRGVRPAPQNETQLLGMRAAHAVFPDDDLAIAIEQAVAKHGEA